MTGNLLLRTTSPFLACVAMSACTAIDVQQEVPDFIVQHTLSSLTSEESFAWVDSPGRTLVIRPLGTFKSGDYFCRDYEVSLEDVRGTPVRRTACRFDERWTDVDPENLEL